MTSEVRLRREMRLFDVTMIGAGAMIGVGIAPSTVVAALPLRELDFAREIVLAAFLIGFGAIGVAFALGVGIGSPKAIQGALSSAFTPKEKD